MNLEDDDVTVDDSLMESLDDSLMESPLKPTTNEFDIFQEISRLTVNFSADEHQPICQYI
jgi:hypothetical protein